MACTWRVFWPEHSRKKSVNAGVCRRSSTTTSIAFLSSAAFTAFAISPVSFFLGVLGRFFSVLAMQLKGPIQRVLVNMALDQRRHEPRDRFAAREPRAHRG